MSGTETATGDDGPQTLGLTPESTLGEVLKHSAARALIGRAMPAFANSPLISDLVRFPVGMLVNRDPALRDDPAARARFFAELASVGPDAHEQRRVGRIEPRTDYEGPDVATGSAHVTGPDDASVNAPCDIVLTGPGHGNPFTDVEVGAWLVSPTGERVRVGGFYDGDGTYIVRFLPDHAGVWSFTTESTARSLTGIAGTVTVAASANRGPVRVADGFHFAYSDGTRYSPWGTTAYAWTNQPHELQEQTLRTLAASPFNKIRMAVFPKSYLYNTNEPDLFPFACSAGGGWDTTRFDVGFFRHLEGRIRDLDAIGVQADVILFHPYDRWGFADLDAAADDRYVEYVVRRLSGLPNVWWAMANEFDLMAAKSDDDWERLAQVVRDNDPVRHLQSIHNCIRNYDHSRPWITHASVQRTDVYRTAENTDLWREQWHKPVVVDECGYEGDLDLGWGNLTAEELVRRAWEGAVRGGYVQHGETYYNDERVLWWSKGGTLIGDSPARIAFLARIVAEAPTGVLDPLKSDWDTPYGGVAGTYVLLYFGFNRPRSRTVALDVDTEYHVDVIDTWNMTIDRLPGTFSGVFTVDLPSRQYMALRLVAA